MTRAWEEFKASTFHHIMYFLSRWSKIGSVVEHEDLVTFQCCLGKLVSLCEICGHGLLHQYMKVAHSLHANLIV